MQRIRRFGQLTDGIVDHGFMRGLFNTWASLLKQRKLKYYPRRRPKTNLREHTAAPGFYISIADLEDEEDKVDEETNMDTLSESQVTV